MTSRIVKILLTIIVLYAAFYRVDWPSLASSLSLVSIGWFSILLLLLILCFTIPSLAQYYLFRLLKLKIPWQHIYKINLVSMFYSLVVPGDIASGLVRVVRLGKSTSSDGNANTLYPEVVSVLVWDKILQVFSLVLLFICSVWFTSSFSFLKLYLLPAVVGAIIIVALLLLICLPKNNVFQPKNNLLKKVFHYFLILRQTTSKLRVVDIIVLLLLLSFFQVGCIVIMDIMPAKMLQINIPFNHIFSVACLIRLARFVPVTLSGIGIREILYPLLITQFAVSQEGLLGLGLVGTSLVISMCLFGGLIELYSIISSSIRKQFQKPPFDKA